MSEKLFVNTEYDCNNLSRLRFPSPEELKVVIWDKELCNDAEWNDFLECVEEKTKENAELKKQLVEKEKEIEELHTQIEQMAKDYTSEIAFYTGTENQKAIQILEKVLNEYEYIPTYNGLIVEAKNWRLRDNWVDINVFIEDQIALLKGEKK